MFRILYKSQINSKFPIRLLSGSTTNYDSKMSFMTSEKMLFSLRRRMNKLYQQGSYDTALKVATELKESIENLVGNDNNIYASALSDQALMYKSVGQYDNSIQAYNTALQVYSQTIGINNEKYVTTLSNKAVVYKMLAEKSTDAAVKDNMLQKSEETLIEAKNIIAKLHEHGNSQFEWSTANANATASIQALVCNNHLCAVYMQRNKHDAAIQIARNTLHLIVGNDYKKMNDDVEEEIYRDSVRYHSQVHKGNRLLLANAFNNLALALKKSVTTSSNSSGSGSGKGSSKNGVIVAAGSESVLNHSAAIRCHYN